MDKKLKKMFYKVAKKTIDDFNNYVKQKYNAADENFGLVTRFKLVDSFDNQVAEDKLNKLFGRDYARLFVACGHWYVPKDDDDNDVYLEVRGKDITALFRGVIEKMSDLKLRRLLKRFYNGKIVPKKNLTFTNKDWRIARAGGDNETLNRFAKILDGAELLAVANSIKVKGGLELLFLVGDKVYLLQPSSEGTSLAELVDED